MNVQRARLMEYVSSYENVSQTVCLLGKIEFWIQELQLMVRAFVYQPHVLLTVLVAKHDRGGI